VLLRPKPPLLPASAAPGDAAGVRGVYAEGKLVYVDQSKSNYFRKADLSSSDSFYGGLIYHHYCWMTIELGAVSIKMQMNLDDKFVTSQFPNTSLDIYAINLFHFFFKKKKLLLLPRLRGASI
jgi:hypothetical protein